MAIRSSSLETQLMVNPGHHSGSHNRCYVNQVADARMKATGDSIGVAESS